MKKLGIYVMMLAMMAVTFVGCNKDDDETNPVKPVISMPEKMIIDLDDLDAFSFKVEIASAEDVLIAIDVYITMGATTVWTDPVTLDKNAKGWTKTYTVADFPDIEVLQAGEGLGLTFCVDAKTDNESASKTAPITIEGGGTSDTPLVKGEKITLIYTGQTQSDGRNVSAVLGIKWRINNGTPVVSRFVTEPGGGTFVMLDKATHDAIDTQEALKEKYNAPGADKKDEFAVSPGSQCYFISKVGENYNLVNLTSLVYAEGNNKAEFDYQH
jgi:hypothetical protein